MSRQASHETAFHWMNDAAEATTAEQALIFYATMTAQNANTNPYQSNYHVRAAAIDKFGQLVATGGNREKTLSDAIHGETAAISNFRAQFGETAIKAVCFYNESRDLTELASASPCGPCRDTLLQEVNTSTFITIGNEDIISVSRLSDFLKDDFTPIMTIETDMESVTEANYARFMADYHYLPEDKYLDVYGVALADQNGNKWMGSLHTTSGYNEVSPGYAARIAWESTLRPGDRRADMDRITIVSMGGLPQVEYRDRQVLLEFDEMLMKKYLRPTALRVDLVHIDEGGPVEAATTNTLEWLPRPFSAALLGLSVPEDQAERLRYLETEGDN